MPKITNSILRQLLADLGFEQGHVTSKMQRAFRHPESGCTLLLPENKSAEAPRPADLAGIRGHLVYQGHVHEEAFDRFLEQGTAGCTEIAQVARHASRPAARHLINLRGVARAPRPPPPSSSPRQPGRRKQAGRTHESRPGDSNHRQRRPYVPPRVPANSGAGDECQESRGWRVGTVRDDSVYLSFLAVCLPLPKSSRYNVPVLYSTRLSLARLTRSRRRRRASAWSPTGCLDRLTASRRHTSRASNASTPATG